MALHQHCNLGNFGCPYFIHHVSLNSAPQAWKSPRIQLRDAWPVADDAAELKVGLREVVADGQQWLVAQLGGRVRHTVSEVESRAVAPLPYRRKARCVAAACRQ